MQNVHMSLFFIFVSFAWTDPPPLLCFDSTRPPPPISFATTSWAQNI
jgi:hypothetical protein